MGACEEHMRKVHVEGEDTRQAHLSTFPMTITNPLILSTPEVSYVLLTLKLRNLPRRHYYRQQQLKTSITLQNLVEIPASNQLSLPFLC